MIFETEFKTIPKKTKRKNELFGSIRNPLMEISWTFSKVWKWVYGIVMVAFKISDLTKPNVIKATCPNMACIT